ncbi:MFS transporter [Microbulbifer agarilyticus]|uniref:MFS transporter n=1 Tax=Microbulbifer agarilyticus TaxID=260552 RepID=UPI001C949E5A|nr:MFS transporter [Microbulbifer agarilyticus]MBY6188967.1 MFS transporter [Microbulbifer agarilyticus]
MNAKYDQPHSLQNLVSLLFVAMMGASILTLLPLWVGALTDRGHFSGQEIGWLASADVIGIFLSSTSAIFWVRKLSWRPVVLAGLGLFVAGNLASLSVDNFTTLMMIRIIAGIGCGSAYAIALAGLGDRKNPQMAFGLMVTAQVVFGTIGFFVLPRLMGEAEINPFFHYLNGWLLATLLLCFLSFPKSQKSPSHESGNVFTTLLSGKALLVFATTVVYYCGVSSVWAYLERIGINLGLSSADVGDLLGIGFAISGLGSLATPWLSKLVGRALTLLIAFTIQILTMAVLTGEYSGGAYALYASTSIVFQFFWSFSLPLLMDQFNRVDGTGRFIVLCASAFKVGEIAGPPLAAALISASDFTAVLWLGMACMAATLVMALFTERRQAESTPLVAQSA